MTALKKSSFIKIFLLLLFISGVGYVLYRQYKLQQNSLVSYKAFGIDIPAQYNIHGIDVSKYQSYIHWPLVKSMKVKNTQIGFAFIKATQGANLTDNFYKRNKQLCYQNKLPCGAYHYFEPDVDVAKQMQHFIQTATLQKGDLPPVLDVEELGRSSLKEFKIQVKTCLAILEKHYKTKPILYTYANFYSNYLGNEFDSCRLWIAHYQQKDKPEINRPWQFWQHSETGHVNGIAAKVDFNVFNGDSIAFKKLLLK